MSDTPDSEPLTPCVNICVIHPEARVCTGCLRTRDEIAAWGGMNNDERRAVMEGLKAREILLQRRRGGRAGKLARRGADG